MTDYIEITAGSGKKVSVDEGEIGGVSGVQVQRTKQVFGKDGELKDVSSENPLPISDAGGSLTVDGTVSVGEPTVKVAASQTIGLAAGTAEVGKVKVTELSGEPKVKVASLEGEPKVKAIGDVASGSGDSGNPVKVGGVVRTELPTAGEAGNRINAGFDKYGRSFMAPFPLDKLITGKVLLENETSTEVIAAQGAGKRILVTDILVTNASTTVATRVEILDEATGKVIGNAGVGGGFEKCNPFGLFVGTANKPVKAKCLTTGAKVDVFISGYQLPE